MDEKPQKRQKLLLIVLAVLVLFAVYFFFLRGGNNIAIPEVSFDEFGNPIETAVVGQDLISLLDEIQGVTLSGETLFASPAFISLTDYAIDLPNIPQGRSNPFIPVGEAR